MSDTQLQSRAEYEERYDKTTVELCRVREEMVSNVFGERPSLDSRGDADPTNGYYIYSVFYFQFVEALAGERWQQRDDTVQKWMVNDEDKARRLTSIKPAVVPYCRSCGDDMEITLKTYLHRKRNGKDEQDILFMFECKPCNKRIALWQDGTEWEGYQASCEKCGASVEETDKRRGNTITSTYTCASCGYDHTSTLRLGAEPKVEAEDPLFKLDRRRFCFDAATGKKFLARKAHLEHIRALLKQERQHAAGTETVDAIEQAVSETKRLKVAQIADLISDAVAKDGYTEFKLGDPQLGREMAVPFGCLDAKPYRQEYDSRIGLKKLITSTLTDTNWTLMSDGVRYRMGHLSGQLRAHESEDDLRALAAKQIESGVRKQAERVSPPPPVEPPKEATSTKQRSRGKQTKAVRVRGVLHPNLHILIPPREPKGPRRNEKSGKSKGG